MPHGLPRRSTAIAAGALLLTSALSSCGFDYATNRVNTISSGINNQEGEVDVLGAVIISGAPDTGVFVASLSNANPDEAVSLTGLAGDVAPAEDLAPVEVTPMDLVSLFDTGGVPLSGSIGPGDFLTVELTFDSGQVSTLEIPVVSPCFEYDPEKFPSLDVPRVGESAPDATETETDTETGGEEEGETTKATDPYSCNPIEQEPQGEGEE